MQPNTEISHRSSNLFSATEVAETIGTDLETINEWLEVGAIDRAVFGGGRFSKYELQRAALTFEMVIVVKLPPCRQLPYMPAMYGRVRRKTSAPRTCLTPLNTWPKHSPINASLAASRPHAHDSGPVWLATPSP